MMLSDSETTQVKLEAIRYPFDIFKCQPYSSPLLSVYCLYVRRAVKGSKGLLANFAPVWKTKTY